VRSDHMYTDKDYMSNCQPVATRTQVFGDPPFEKNLLLTSDRRWLSMVTSSLRTEFSVFSGEG
jgi:hypothetical protein